MPATDGNSHPTKKTEAGHKTDLSSLILCPVSAGRAGARSSGQDRYSPFSAQRHPSMPQEQAVSQVQTGSQLQLQFWQVQEALDGSGD